MEENKVKKQKWGAPAPGAPPPRSATDTCHLASQPVETVGLKIVRI